ncbi:MAG: tRNA (adenine(58)-N(1))-methyltransferase non-catalytic subunit trm6 [Trizodia sp. TS-e1964]|nr:MAG: tRNA (adenine(58)-N(1))-methyltransferase non-catalytic subunit trm6 [Trizodia sp. TS-e1964]
MTSTRPNSTPCCPRIQPDAWVVLRLPSESLKVVQIVPHTTISLGKYGAFPSNLLLSRPFNLTFEIVDKAHDQGYSNLRIVSAEELYADILSDSSDPAQENSDAKQSACGDGLEYELLGENGEVVVRSNRETVDDPGRQSMTMDEIEALKREGTGAGRDLISRLMLSHSALDEKTSFSLAKYTLRKSRKYIRRFTVLPLDVSILTEWLLLEKDPMKIMELREELISLIGSWANIRYIGENDQNLSGNPEAKFGKGRWLVVDETAGLLTAALAERMGILNYQDSSEEQMSPPEAQGGDSEQQQSAEGPALKWNPSLRQSGMSSSSNTLTIIHANAQPNLSMLKYFQFDPSNPSTAHPLYMSLKTISWIQLVSPEEDSGYAEPDVISDELLQTYKSGKRGTYHRKRRRWERIKRVVDETRAGGYDGLVIASAMNSVSILRHVIPLLRGAAPIVVYSPSIEPLAELTDIFSTSRRTAFISEPPDLSSIPSSDFPLNPTLLLSPSIQTVRVRRWQCLPGRTHPVMTDRGGAEGYIFHATKVLPAEGKVEARGKFKKRKITTEKSQSLEIDVIKDSSS